MVTYKSSKTKPIRVGEHLHIALVTIQGTPQKPIVLRPKVVYSYNMQFHGASGVENFFTLGLLNAPVTLGFEVGMLPSFVMPPEKLVDLRIAHGSCRKPHGMGRDGLAALAEVIKKDFSELTSSIRPHYFFHTGDQIYADNISDFLIQYTTDAGNFLLQKIEQLPFPKDPTLDYSKQKPGDADFVWMQATSAALPPARRATNFYTGFTGVQGNHLFSFAEFAATYLFQWCDVLWPTIEVEDEHGEKKIVLDLPESEEVYFDKLNDGKETRPYLLYIIKEGDTDEKGKPEKDPTVPKNWDNLDVAARRSAFISNDLVKKGIEGFKAAHQRKTDSDPPREKDLVISFWKDLKAARRVLANVPNIMSFDDHDVTDDWYINGEWSKRVLGTKLGEAVIRNGLLAFALFQSWGNDPKGWGDTTTGKNDRSNLLNEIPLFVDTFKPYNNTDSLISSTAPPKNGEFVPKFQKALGFTNFENPPVKWHCSLKISEAVAFVLDTRTRRDFSQGLLFPPNLIGPKALVEQIPNNAMPFGTELAIVISGAPVLGLTAIESIGQPIVSRVLDVKNYLFSNKPESFNIKRRNAEHTGRESMDVEHWSIHQAGFEALLKRCATLKRVLFLGGDVHYGIASEMDYWVKGTEDGARFVQMVSSALKNSKPEGTLVGTLPAGMVGAVLGGGFSREFTDLTSIGWEDAADIKKLKLRVQTSPGRFEDAKITDVPAAIASALSRKQVFLVLRDWPLKDYDPVNAGGKSNVLNRIVFKKDSPQPGFIWKMNVVGDQRPDKERFNALPSSRKNADLVKDIPANRFNGNADFDAGLAALVDRSAFYNRSHFSRIVTWFSHSAIIDFVMKGQELFARQSMFYYPFFATPDDDSPPGTFEKPYTRYEVSLERKKNSKEQLPPYPLESTT